MSAGIRKRVAPYGFTLVELLVAIIVIGTLVGLLLTGLTIAGRYARKQAQQQTLSGIKQATLQFQRDFGFLPPLVYDGSEVPGGDPSAHGAFSNAGPVYVDSDGRSLVNVYKLGDPAARAFLRGGAINAGALYEDGRYSKFSLSFYLTGALSKEVDGVEGPGMTEPNADGSWSGVGDALGGSNKTYDSLIDTTKSSLRLLPQYADPDEGVPSDLSNRIAMVDSTGKAYRYYRWLHGKLNGDEAENTLELNIPAALLDPITYASAQSDSAVDVTEGNARMRSATWAIVGAGADGLFGTEDLSVLRSKLGVPDSMGEALVRQRAMDDNVVEFGE